MFGIYRLYLALMVLLHHYYSVQSIGLWAVVSFFVLSGFLMTTIMQTSYGYSSTGLKKYALNRLLRLFPSYYFVALVTVVLLVAFPAMQNKTMFLSGEYQDILANLTMIFPAYFPIEYAPRLIPPTWALTIEIFFYCIIAVGVSRTPVISLVWLGASLLYLLYKAIDGSWLVGIGYGNIFDASLPFSLGAISYHYRQTILNWMSRFRLADWRLVTVLFVINQLLTALGGYAIGDEVWKIAFVGSYMNIGLSVMMIVSLFTLEASPDWKKRDALAGQYSYPVYLTHVISGSVAFYIADMLGWAGRGLGFTALALVLTFFLGAICVFQIDERIEQVRRKIKKQNT